MIALFIGGLTQTPKLEVRALPGIFAQTTTPEARAALAVDLSKWVGKPFADTGVGFKQDQLLGLWIVRAPENSHPTVVSADGTITTPTVHVAADVHIALRRFPDGSGFNWLADIDGKQTKGGLVEFYKTNPDMVFQPGVPKGKVTQMPEFQSQVFAGTKRNWWIYIPANIKPTDRPAVMVFQDGGGPKGYAAPCLDNLIAKGDIPPMVGIFVDPGHFDDKKSNRNFEYDTLSDQYSKFIIDEVLPAVEKIQPLTSDPKMRGIAGASSGGICAFTVAWHRPDMFTKVLSWVGSFVNLAPGKTGIEGGHNYPAMIRKFDKKPIRVFLQDGENDLDNPFGNWPLANKYMANSLAFRDWDYKFIFGHGGHNDRHGRATMPEAMRWLWRDWK